MKAWRGFALLGLLSSLALVLATCVHARVEVRESAIDVESVVVDATLGLFLNLASLQIQDPAVVPRLLNADPRVSAETLRKLVPGFQTYEEQLARMAQLRAIVLFLDRGSDPVQAARAQSQSVTPWPAHAPPALLSGPAADILILFEPLTTAGNPASSGRPVALARIASMTLPGLALAQSSTTDSLDRRLYLVRPREWKRSAMFEHTRCREPRPELEIVTKLTYQGGFTATRRIPLSPKDWKPCELVSGSAFRSVTVKQAGLDTAGRPVIIAASYFKDPRPGPLLADWVKVN